MQIARSGLEGSMVAQMPCAPSELDPSEVLPFVRFVVPVFASRVPFTGMQELAAAKNTASAKALS